MSEWQPIDTAPTGQLILAYTHQRLHLASRIVVGKLRRPGIISTRPGWWDNQATHWMPLPDPPVKE